MSTRVDIPQQLTLAETSPEYEQFVAKFVPKKTTDDCYTPQNIYTVVLDYVCETYGVNREQVVRPFWPGGDYTKYEYEDDSVVVDNPPFSIMSEIVEFYNHYRIKYFLFAPHLTNFGIARGVGCCHIIQGNPIVYENGAIVSTSFVTNMDDRLIVADPNFFIEIEKANEANRKKSRVLPKYSYPNNVLTVSRVAGMVNKGIPFELRRRDAAFIRLLDAQRIKGKSIFGGGFLISDQAAEAAAEAAAETAAEAAAETAEVWELSARELRLVKTLGEK